MKHSLDKKLFENLQIGDSVFTCLGEKGTVVYKGTLKDCLENGNCNDGHYSISDFAEFQDCYDKPMEDLDAVCVIMDNVKATLLYDDIYKVE